MIKTEFKAHPIMILSLMKPYLFVLVLPLIRALIQYLTVGEIDGLLALEIVAFAFILTTSVLNWRSISITVNDRRLTVKKGFIFKSHAVIEVSRLSSVSLKQGPLDIIAQSVQCSINTEAGRPKKSDFSFKMQKNDAKRLFELIYGEESRTTIKISPFKIALLAATTSSAATGIIVGVPIVNRASDLLGVAISDMLLDEINNVSLRFNNIFPPIVNTITIILFAAYGVSFLISFFKNVNFKLQSGKNSMDIRSGVIVRKRIVFKKSQVNNICLEQTPLLRLFKRFSMRASIGGYGDGRGEKAVVIPVASHDEIEQQFKMHFPISLTGENAIKPERSAANLNRFLYIPTIILMVVIATGLCLGVLFPYFESLILFLAVVAIVADLYYANVCYRNYKHGNLCFEDCIFASGSAGFKIRELYCEKNRIGVIKVTQTPADRKFGTCKVKLTVRSENADSVRVKNLKTKEVGEKIEEIFLIK